MHLCALYDAKARSAPLGASRSDVPSGAGKRRFAPPPSAHTGRPTSGNDQRVGGVCCFNGTAPPAEGGSAPSGAGGARSATDARQCIAPRPGAPVEPERDRRRDSVTATAREGR
ncbi:hypothetical protein [Halomonas sp. AOP42-A1-14]|uniref:hypothetical protein n=1 Tax=Halomonas sp. AOP42-A1-14 TaxID=3457676 RepID=UPI0040340C70